MTINVVMPTCDFKMQWHKDILDFPKVISFFTTYYEWVAYDRSKNPGVDYELIFGKIGDDDVRTKWPNIPDLIDLLNERVVCECGSKKLGHPSHSSWCPEFRSLLCH